MPGARRPRLAGNKEGLLQVDVVPPKDVAVSKWEVFKRRLRMFFGRPEEVALDYIEAADEAGREKLRGQAVKNAQLEADIELKLARARKINAEARAAEIEAEKREALSEIEIRARQLELRAEALKKLQALGVEVLPMLDDSEVLGLLITKKDKGDDR